MVGYEGLYEVSDLGLVWSLRRQIVLKPSPNQRGRLHVALHKDGTQKTRYVHKLVSRAFHGECPAGMEVCHWDGDCSNNRADNLRYGTHAENMQDQIRHGRHAPTNKSTCPKGHPLDGVKKHLGKEKRYCKQCNRDRRMANYAADREGEKQKMRDRYRRRTAA